MAQEVVTAEEYRAMMAQEENKRGNKFGAVRAESGDRRKFDSTGERDRWEELGLLLASGTVRNLRRQVRYELEVNGIYVCAYVADFVYEEQQGGAWVEVVEDWKSRATRTEAYKIKAALMFACHGIVVRETGR